MRRIINFGLSFGVLYFGNLIFPELIVIKDVKTVLLATVLLFAFGYIISLLVAMSALLIPVGIGCVTIIPTIVVAIFSTPTALYLLDKYLDGFNINGTMAFILLWIMISLFTLKAPQNSKNE